MEDLILVVNLTDFAYPKPIAKVAYAGKNMNNAYSIYYQYAENEDRMQVTLDLVQGENVKRLETHEFTNSFYNM